nr:M56 family metallopeptidase [Acetatifactor sp.]
MEAVFLKMMNLSLNASWLILAVVIARFLLKKAPRWISCLLWGLVAIRLLCPISLESALSLLPSGEVIPENIALEALPRIDSGVVIIDNAVNPALETSSAMHPNAVASVNPLQIVIVIASFIWILGM